MQDSKEKRLSIYRKAELEDIISIAQLLREFYDKEGAVYDIPFDYESCLVTVDDVVRRGICLVGPTSCAGAIPVGYPMNDKAIVAQLAFWYFRNPREIEIFDAFVNVCRAVGITHVSAYSHFPKNTIGKLYVKKGLHKAEIGFIGRINGKPD